MPGNGITVEAMAGALGAEIGGVDLSRELDNATTEAIHAAFLEHQVIVFRDQTLTPQRQVAVARMFGKPARYPFLQGLEEAPEVNELLKTEADTTNFGGVWHSDTTYKECPDMASMLYALEVPAAGGDTLYADMYSAYDGLSAGMRALIEPLVGVNSSEGPYKNGRAARIKALQGMKDAYADESPVLENSHPVVRTHPETGRKALYLNKAHTIRFADMTAEESKPLIDYLGDHAVRPEFTCRVRWRPGTLVVWDNRCTQHFAVNDYQGQRRRMHRVTIEGDRPFH